MANSRLVTGQKCAEEHAGVCRNQSPTGLSRDMMSKMMHYAAHEIFWKRLELLRAFSWLVSWLGLQLQEAVDQRID